MDLERVFLFIYQPARVSAVSEAVFQLPKRQTMFFRKMAYSLHTSNYQPINFPEKGSTISDPIKVVHMRK